jgi:L-ornithine Nalpha-acyltransferase
MSLIEAKRARLVDVRVGGLHMRLAETAEEVMAAQALRYRVFYEGTAAKPTVGMAASRRDFDTFDEFCDHLLVFDEARGDRAHAVVGAYRMMRRAGASRRGQFYSADEYDIAKLVAVPGEILELGRSCIDPAYRTGTVMQILWQGIADYVLGYDIKLMFGCASLPGTDPYVLAAPLTYLYRNHLAPAALRPRALDARYVSMDRLPDGAAVPQRALKMMPPLIKGYLRLGGFVGDGAVVDHDFGTTDVCVVVKTDLVTDRYFRHYTRGENNNRDQDGKS